MLKRFLIEVLTATVTMLAWSLFMGVAYEWLPYGSIAGSLILTSLVVFMVAGMVVHRHIEGHRSHAD